MEFYEALEILGEGTYGVVIKARHRISQQLVAIKKFKLSEDDEHVRKTALREVRVLKQLHHPNIVGLIDVFRRDGKLHLVFEYIEKTALQMVESVPTGLPPQDVRKITYQLLRSVEYCHARNVVHRDIKPENILISSNGLLKLCDFGFARQLLAKGVPYTDYVATRWYRAPELLVGDLAYGKAVDIWAIGCIFAELSDSQPLFPGESDLDQLSLILGFNDTFPKRLVHQFHSSSMHRNVLFPSPVVRCSLQERFGAQSPEWVEFLLSCLQPDPCDRLSCQELMNLPYFTKDNFSVQYEAELRLLLPANVPSARGSFKLTACTFPRSCSLSGTTVANSHERSCTISCSLPTTHSESSTLLKTLNSDRSRGTIAESPLTSVCQKVQVTILPDILGCSNPLPSYEQLSTSHENYSGLTDHLQEPSFGNNTGTLSQEDFSLTHTLDSQGQAELNHRSSMLVKHLQTNPISHLDFLWSQYLHDTRRDHARESLPTLSQCNSEQLVLPTMTSGSILSNSKVPLSSRSRVTSSMYSLDRRAPRPRKESRQTTVGGIRPMRDGGANDAISKLRTPREEGKSVARHILTQETVQPRGSRVAAKQRSMANAESGNSDSYPKDVDAQFHNTTIASLSYLIADVAATNDCISERHPTPSTTKSPTDARDPRTACRAPHQMIWQPPVVVGLKYPGTGTSDQCMTLKPNLPSSREKKLPTMCRGHLDPPSGPSALYRGHPLRSMNASQVSSRTCDLPAVMPSRKTK